MKRTGHTIDLSATDLVGFLNCRHLTDLDRAVLDGTLAKPKAWSPLLDVLRERGVQHEAAYIEHLARQGNAITRIEGTDISTTSVAETRRALERGVPIVVQGALSNGAWAGRADILRRVETKSALGAWSYEVMDTKLARETKAGSVLQLCVYSDLLASIQGETPELMHIVAPWTEFVPQSYRFTDYAAYFRRVRDGLAAAVAAGPSSVSYPDPKPHCDVCRWAETCDKRRRADDHLCLVAGISKVQIGELETQGVSTMATLAALPLPLTWKPERGSAPSYHHIREQARLQVEARTTGQKVFELLPIEPGFGLTRLPAPSRGDIFLDFEGDPFVGEHGLEYLLGFLAEAEADAGASAYHHHWAFTRAEEKQAFEAFVDLVMERWQRYPDMHIYHYAPYEPAALKRLMGRYATREDEIDRMLRGRLFVDLYQIVRHALRASVESYSIKQLEPFYDFERATPLPEANAALLRLQSHLELGDPAAIDDPAKAVVRDYNAEDCRSAASLRDWLEAHRAKLIAQGADIPRPAPGDGTPSENISAWLLKIAALIETLTVDVPVDPGERSPGQQGRWVLAHILDWHRREQKAVWWEYFRLRDLSAEDLMDERAGLSGLTFVARVGGTDKAPVHRYRFPAQDCDLRGEEDLHLEGGAKFGKVEAVSLDDWTIDIKKRQDTAALHPPAVFAHKVIGTEDQADALVRIGDYVAEHGLDGVGPFQAARDLLLKRAPRVGGEPLARAGETPLQSALRLCKHLDGGVLPIQGPPGAGKTYVGANMIVELVRLGKTVGVTANSHKVIRHLIDEAIKVAKQKGVAIDCCIKPKAMEPPQKNLSFAKSNKDVFKALGNGTDVGGGTTWLWSVADAADTLDVLFVDEAAQISLANVLAVSPAARTVVLIGDPRQLDQPMQGSHPEGTDVSALDHMLDTGESVAKAVFISQRFNMFSVKLNRRTDLCGGGNYPADGRLSPDRSLLGSAPRPAAYR